MYIYIYLNNKLLFDLFNLLSFFLRFFKTYKNNLENIINKNKRFLFINY